MSTPEAEQIESLKAENEHLRCSILGLHHWRECSLNASTGPKQHPMVCERCRAEAAERQVQQLREAHARLQQWVNRITDNENLMKALRVKLSAASPVSPQPTEEPKP